MKEAELSRTVIKTAQQLGWRVAHFRTAMSQSGRFHTAVAGDGAGFPDLVLVRGSRVLYAELKQDRAYPKPNQREWLQTLREAGQEVFVWRPKDWHDGTIVTLLNHCDMSHSSKGVDDA